VIYREAGQFKTSYAADHAIFPILQDRVFIGAVLLVAYLVLIPFVASPYFLVTIMIPSLIFCIAALGLNVLTGYAGQLSLGTGGFMAVGAYATFKMTTMFPDLNIIIVFLLSGLFAAGGRRALRHSVLAHQGLLSRGRHACRAVLPDLAVQPRRLVLQLRPVGHHLDPPARPLRHRHRRQRRHADGALHRGAVAGRAVRARGQEPGAQPHGRMWMAVRDMDIAAEIMGIRLMWAKLSAFAFSSYLCGVAGALYFGLYLRTVETIAFDIVLSFLVLFMIIVGGLGSVLGSILGAFFIISIPILLTRVPDAFGIPIGVELARHLETIIFGSLIIFFLIVEPNGLARLWQIVKEKLRRWPFPY
jgi:branched-chain amino acid transport system permease protein